ncbi:MAG: leucine-rich repeat protein [Bacilli bacterium]|nr:leucine-rich repeat protein [Bacilli bacterium]
MENESKIIIDQDYVKNILKIKKSELNTNCSSIPPFTFLHNQSVEEVIIKDDITSISVRAFDGCSNLKKITLSNNITIIDRAAFYNCKNLTEITLPEGLKAIGYNAFGYCKRLKKIVIPSSVEEIEFGAFMGCENLEEVVLPDNLKELPDELFWNCTKLTKVNIPKGITEIPKKCFKGCRKINISLSNNIKKIGSEAFEGCYKQETFPENVVAFGTNAFKECRSLTSVNFINDDPNNPTKSIKLSDGLFDGCINLTNINSNNQILIGGKRTFRNCKSLTNTPENLINLNNGIFENCTGLTSVDINQFTNYIDNTTDNSITIPKSCFKGCTNLKEIKNFNKISTIKPFGFSGCKSIEEVNLSKVVLLDAEAFSNCSNLKKVTLNKAIDTIKSRTFYNCANLVDIKIPDSVRKIETGAFSRCKSITSITIPRNLKVLKDDVWGNCDSLENIYVNQNSEFYTPDNKILLNKDQTKLLLYAMGSKNESYSLVDLCMPDEDIIDGRLQVIGPYAFAGAKNLKVLTICSCTSEISTTSFKGCDNLKVLNVEMLEGYTLVSVRLDNALGKAEIPFEKLNIKNTYKVPAVMINKFSDFNKLKELTIPDETISIGYTCFNESPLINSVNIPDKTSLLEKDSFNPNTHVIFSNGLNGNNFNQSYTDKDYLGNNYRVYQYNNDIYYLEDENKNIIKITKEEMKKSCSHAEYIIDYPVKYYAIRKTLKEKNIDFDVFRSGILMKNGSNDNLKMLFNYATPEDQFLVDVIKSSKLFSDDKDTNNTEFLLEDSNFKNVIDYVETLKKYQIKNTIFYNKMLMANLNATKFDELIQIDINRFEKFIQSNPIDVTNDNEKAKRTDGKEILKKTNDTNLLINHLILLRDFNITDPLFYNPHVVLNANNVLMSDLVRIFDKNTKRLIMKSEALVNESTANDDFHDLLTLMKMTGALEADPIIRQKASTFIIDNMFSDMIQKGNSNKYHKNMENRVDSYENKYQIKGNQIHKVFDILGYDIYYDPEFMIFFMENYKELYNAEQEKSGTISRIYLNFKEISKTCTSDRGSQRKLKVTLEKCMDYLNTNKFNGVNEDNKELADLIGKWFSDDKSWQNANIIYKESLKAPRNIFTEVKFDTLQGVIYDMDPEHDLREEINENYSYEWLPKQDYNNLVLGKYCGCCAHVNGAGQGIMRASMTLDSCQNMVIRNELGEIIAKATIFVNKNEHYAVFNTIENCGIADDDKEKKYLQIYHAFMRGAKAFIEEYNKNNPENWINIITVGDKQYKIFNYFKEDIHPATVIYKSLEFGKYSLSGSGWAGDWNKGQKLVIKA